MQANNHDAFGKFGIWAALVLALALAVSGYGSYKEKLNTCQQPQRVQAEQ